MFTHRASIIGVSLFASLTLSALTSRAQAQIEGFPFTPPGTAWRTNQWDSASRPLIFPPDAVILTSGTTNQCRSLFHAQKQNARQFEARFIFEFDGTAASRMGSAFVIHNKPPADETVARGVWSGVTTNLGYTDGVGTFGGASLAVALATGYEGAGVSSWGVYTGGSFGGGGIPTAPVDFFSGNPIDVAIFYDGGLVSLEATDTVSGETYESPALFLDAAATLGSGRGTVGFTASTNNNAGTSQSFSNFLYIACPPDLDADGTLTIFDFLAFQNAFDAGDPIADFDGDRELTIFDFLAFQNAFDVGCE